MRQFLMTDPGGNTIRIGRPIETPEPPAQGGRLERAFANALVLGESGPLLAEAEGIRLSEKEPAEVADDLARARDLADALTR
ncbi:hypothetical protein AB0B45_48800 [Nonomuraea sp. NPDC049152]|uniref:hypothetical protein n=1 Tax=Nonomuraea sp. NPDC049152 TaxID=3154350 RepID=UPI0033F45327